MKARLADRCVDTRDDSLHVAVSVTEGRTVRDLFYNGLVDRFREAGFTLTIFTEAAQVPDFTKEWERPGIEFAPLLPCDQTPWQSRAFQMRRRVVRLRNRTLLRTYLAWEAKHFYAAKQVYVDALQRRRPALLLATHAHLASEAELINTAHAM